MNQNQLFQQKLKELRKLVHYYVKHSKDAGPVHELAQVLKIQVPSQETIKEETTDSVMLKLGANGKVSIKKTAMGPTKIYTVAANDYPIAIADKLGLTITQLAKLQVPWMVKLLGLKRTGQFDFKRLVANSKQNRDSEYWIKGFAKDWIIHPNDELLATVPHDKIVKQAMRVAKKEEKPWGYDFYANNGLVQDSVRTGQVEDHYDVSDLFAAFGGRSSSNQVNWKGVLLRLRNVGHVLQVAAGSIALRKDIEDAIKNNFIPSRTVNTTSGGAFNISVKFVDTIKEKLKNEPNKAKRKKIEQEANQILANQKLPPINHQLYQFDGTLSMYVPSGEYPSHYIRRDAIGKEKEDYTQFYISEGLKLVPSKLAEGGFLNLKFKKNTKK